MGIRPIRSRLRYVVLALIVLTSSACTHESPAPTPSVTATPADTATAAIARAERATREALSLWGGGTAAHVILIRDGSEVRTIAEGMADVAAQRKVTPDDRFPIASLTKPIVATAVLQYVESGRIRLDDPVAKWLHGVVPNRQITVRQLLSHRSGIHELNLAEEPRLHSMTPRMIVATAARRPLDFTPGTDGAYSNTGYLVLGLLLEQLSGRPLAVALREAVFGPAGMTNTTLSGRPTVVAYSATQRLPEQVDPVAAAFPAAGGVVSTVRDLDGFRQHLLAGDLLRKDLVDTMMEPTGTKPFGQGDYGLGLWLVTAPCGDTVGHGGSLTGVAANLSWLKSANRSVVVLINDGSELGNAGNLAVAALCG